MKKNLKQIISVCLTTCLALSSVCVVHADNITLYVNENEVSCEQPPVIENGRTLVPVRVVSENLGCKVDWYQDDQSVVVSSDKTSFALYIGEPYVVSGDYQQYIDVSPTIMNGRTMVPIRVISEMLGYDVQWLESTQSVYVNSLMKYASGSSNTGETANAYQMGVVSESGYKNGYFGVQFSVPSGCEMETGDGASEVKDYLGSTDKTSVEMVAESDDKKAFAFARTIKAETSNFTIDQLADVVKANFDGKSGVASVSGPEKTWIAGKDCRRICIYTDNSSWTDEMYMIKQGNMVLIMELCYSSEAKSTAEKLINGFSEYNY